MESLMKKITIGMVSFISILVVWGLIEPYVIDIEEEEAAITNLSSAWEEEKIAVIGDFQVGMWLDNTATVEWMIEDLIEMNPRAVLLTGDYVYHATDGQQDEITKIVELLRPLTASGIPVFGVLGNHDYAMKAPNNDPNEELAQKISSQLEETGVQMLQNESAVLEGTNESQEGLYIVGIDSEWADRDNPSQAFSNVPESAPRLVLMHNPDTFKKIQPTVAPVATAGHTHGGQMRIPFTENWSYLALVQEGEIHADGWIPEYGAEGNNLYVNRGVGFSLVPLRIFCPPEITVFTLTSS